MIYRFGVRRGASPGPLLLIIHTDDFLTNCGRTLSDAYLNWPGCIDFGHGENLRNIMEIREILIIIVRCFFLQYEKNRCFFTLFKFNVFISSSTL